MKKLAFFHSSGPPARATGHLVLVSLDVQSRERPDVVAPAQGLQLIAVCVRGEELALDHDVLRGVGCGGRR